MRIIMELWKTFIIIIIIIVNLQDEIKSCCVTDKA